MLRFLKRRAFRKLQRHDLPGEVGSVDLPRAFFVQLEEESTLLAWPPGEETISLRFSSISFVKRGVPGSPAKEHVRQLARERGCEFRDDGERGMTSFEQNEASSDGESLRVLFWYVGARNTVVIASATILRESEKLPVVQATLDVLPEIIDSIEITAAHAILEKAGREVVTVTRAVEDTPQARRPFAEDESRWLESSLALAQRLGLKYGSGGDLDASELDRVFRRWSVEPGAKEPADLIANALGAAFGALLVERHGFVWNVIEDELGTECAVCDPELADFLAFPRSSVEKRIEDGTREFFADLLVAILGARSDFRPDHSRGSDRDE